MDKNLHYDYMQYGALHYFDSPDTVNRYYQQQVPGGNFELLFDTVCCSVFGQLIILVDAQAI
jgi:hypothetical protein